jgi:hypothetical protein
MTITLGKPTPVRNNRGAMIRALRTIVGPNGEVRTEAIEELRAELRRGALDTALGPNEIADGFISFLAEMCMDFQRDLLALGVKPVAGLSQQKIRPLAAGADRNAGQELFMMYCLNWVLSKAGEHIESGHAELRKKNPETPATAYQIEQVRRGKEALQGRN